MALIASFYTGLKRRNVIRAGVFYAASAWLLVQVATQVFPFFHVSDWVVRWIVVAAVAGFPFAIVFSWFYEWTPRGFRPESEVPPDQSIARQTSRRLDRAIIVVLALAVVALVTDRFVLHRDATPVAAKSVAVLPLANESGNPDDEYFSDGLSEQLIVELAQIPGLKVIGRSSSFRFKGSHGPIAAIAKKLGVATLLEGTVRRENGRARITVELVNAADGRELWSQTFDRPLDDIFAIQSGIAQGVADALRVKLFSGAGQTRPKHHVPGFETYDHYLRGRQLLAGSLSSGHIAGAIKAFGQATAMDPDYAAAFAGLAMAESFMAESTPDPVEALVLRRRAMAHAERAVALDPALGDAYATRGYLRESDQWDWDGALSDLEKALQLDPQDARTQLRYGYLLATLGRLPEAADAYRKAIQEDPLFTPPWYWLGRVQAAQGDFAGAERAMHRILAINPDDPDAARYLAYLSLLQGNPAKALEVFAKLDSATGTAMAEHDLGHPERAQHALDLLIAKYGKVAAFDIAEVYAWSGDPDQAFRWLDRAVDQHDVEIVTLKYAPFLRNLHSDPRFNQLLAKLKLPTEPTPR
ncbi:MAG TPA: tetratricopeptide repeat protein [Rhodanobacteraceae bacterium]|nr:tetratricopeptide repeat protein [Rhodanobacteraceae bacterium]